MACINAGHRSKCKSVLLHVRCQDGAGRDETHEGKFPYFTEINLDCSEGAHTKLRLESPEGSLMKKLK